MSDRYDKAIVSVVVDKALYSFDNEFDYYLPQGVKASVGQRVIVRSAKAVRSVSAL
ncbi:MAG: hypothetical protein ACLS48_04910 [[Eubacterium] siraeum]